MGIIKMSTVNLFWNPFAFLSSKKEPISSPDAKAPNSSPDVKAAPPPGFNFWFNGGVIVKPHDDKVDKGGEDGFAASKTLLVVADGVGGWADQGVDPGLFSKRLCKDI